MAAGLAVGQTVTELAQKEGISRPHASTIANSNEVQHVITGLVNSDYEAITALWGKLLSRMDTALDACAYATSKLKQKDGSVVATPVLIGPDHYARMAAGKLFMTAVCAGRAAPKPIDPADLKPTLTLQQLDALLAQAEAEGIVAGDANIGVM